MLELIKHATNQNPADFKISFNRLISQKLQEKLEEVRVDVAKNLFKNMQEQAKNKDRQHSHLSI